jgi:diguanylate cyclase (GGDEF)-like protein/PAS domain S-box-containing protein
MKAPGMLSSKALRQSAEAIAQNYESGGSKDDQYLSPEALQKILYELRVHQIELEMQNEELRQAQQSLDAERERYFDLYDLAPVGYCTVSAQGLILEANLTAATLLGKARRSLVKEPFSHFIHPADRDNYYLNRKQLLETVQTHSSVLQMVPERGTPFWASLVASVVQTGDAAAVIRIVLSDISELKWADAARQSVLELLQKIASRVPGMVYQYRLRADGSSCFPFASDAIRDIYRVSPEEVREDAGKVFAVIHPDDFDAVVASIQASARALTPWQHEYRVRFVDGTENWLLGNAVPERESDGAVLWHGFITDISARKQVEFALKQSEQSLHISERQMVIAQRISQTGSWTYNMATEKIWGSAEGLRIFGYPALARDFPLAELEACIPERERVHQALLDLISEGHEYDLEFTINPVDGSAARTVHSVATLEADAQGKPQMVLGFVQDITKAKLLEEKVRQLAFFDPLTALPNRRLLLDRLSQAYSAAQRSGCYGTLMFLDLDNFKPLNDSHGHEAGDLLLIEVARRVNECVRAMDTVARIGGDEFVVLVVGLTTDKADSTKQARKVAEKIRTALAEPYLLSVMDSAGDSDGIEHRCSASIGVVLFGKQDQDQNDILRRADAAMYQAKDGGRNRVCFYNKNVS